MSNRQMSSRSGLAEDKPRAIQDFLAETISEEISSASLPRLSIRYCTTMMFSFTSSSLLFFSCTCPLLSSTLVSSSHSSPFFSNSCLSPFALFSCSNAPQSLWLLVACSYQQQDFFPGQAVQLIGSNLIKVSDRNIVDYKHGYI